MSRCAASASFSSRSGRFGRENYPQGPDPGAYGESVNNYDSMASNSKKSMSKSPSMGAFGGRSSRDMPWSNAERDNAERGADEAPVRSTFSQSSARGAAPSAAFAAGPNRFAPTRNADVPGPGDYATQPSPLQSSKRINRSSSFGSRTKRFGGLKQEDTPAPGSFAPKPGAFDSASRKGRSSFGGFGGTSVRASPFAGPTKDTAPPMGAYDAPASTGAFGSASRKSSAAFASRSSRFHKVVGEDSSGPDPTAYNANTYGSMAKEATRTFNKVSTRGGAGFGTSARRPEVHNATEGPAPGSYVYDEKFGAGSDRRSSARPSSAFASKSKNHDSYIRESDAPVGPAYDAHANTGMAASINKSFNRLARSGSFGPRAARKLGETNQETPGPGSYSGSDMTKPSFEATASSARGSRSSAFASTSAARPSATTWAEGGARGM